MQRERSEGRRTLGTTVVFFTSFHYEPMDKCVASVKMLWGLDWLLITWDCFDVAAGNSWRTGLKPSRELCQMINNKDLVNDVCCCQQSLFLSHRMLFLWEALRGKLSCFHVKGALLSVCFLGRLKLFTMQEGFQSLFLCLHLLMRVWEPHV